MAVQNRPTDPNLPDLTWAESPDPPSALDSIVPEKPSDDFIEKGFGFKDVLPHAQFNWLIRSMMRWIRWLVSKVDGHVHDGGTSAGSVTKVNATNHLNWGTFGTFGTTGDNGAAHVITHGGAATNKRIVTGQLHAPTLVRTANIQSTGSGPASAVNVRDMFSANGLLNSAIVQTGTIQRNAVGPGDINVRDANNSNNITLRTFVLNASRIDSNDRILMEDQANSSSVLIDGSFVNFSDPSGDAFIGLGNTPKYIARINANGSVVYSFLARSGSVSITRTAVNSLTGHGEYTFNFPFSSAAAFVTLRANFGFARCTGNGTSFRVLTADANGNFLDQSFSIVVF